MRVAMLPVGILVCAVSLFATDPSLDRTGLKSGFFTTSDGVKLHYLESGSGPAILFVPGWTGVAEFWAPQMRHFAGSHRVVALDPRSQGDSEKPAEGNYHERRGQDIKEAIEQLRLAPVIVVAWSMAVSETLRMVERFGSDQLRAVVFVDGRMNAEPTPEFVRAVHVQMRALLLDRKRAQRELVLTMFKKPHSERLYDTIALANLKTPTHAAVTLLTYALSFDVRPALGKLRKPALLLYQTGPENDAFAKTVRGYLPSAQIEFLDGVGHAIFLDDAEWFNARMSEFVKSLGRN